MTDVEGTGTPDDPWVLTTPPGKSEFEAYRDPDADPAALVVQVGATELRYHLSCIEDLHAVLLQHGDWMPLGNKDEQKEADEGTVEAWGRAGGCALALPRVPRRRRHLPGDDPATALVRHVMPSGGPLARLVRDRRTRTEVLPVSGPKPRCVSSYRQ